ncbi:HD family phosphohydrolase [Pseudalkalibacillus caeni]|uniref:HD family phosphohydrolase n=2 Tax=Exobacillus caeni TaxID=2574798 RepID=A0A5R9FCP2_9BACL|nr:HD family phosphohydrolase [Pseudalkalibacillus caeni]
MYISMLSNIMPESFDVSLYTPAEKDVLSPITIEDKQATEEERAKAAQVEAKYEYKEETVQNQVEKVNEIFSSIQEVNAKAGERAEENDVDTAAGLSSEEKVKQLKPLISQSAEEELSFDTLVTLVSATPSQLNIAKEVILRAVMDAMKTNVSIDELDNTKEQAKKKLLSASVPPELREAMIQLTDFYIVPNYFLDPEKTRQARQEAMEAVKPVMIREGQVLVREGQTITPKVVDQMDIVGLLDKGFDPVPFAGLGLLVIALTGILVYYLKDLPSGVRSANINLLMYCIIFLCTVVIMKLSSLLQAVDYYGIEYLIPAAVGTMLLMLLTNERIALVSSIVFSLCAAVFFNAETIGPMNAPFGFYVLMNLLAGIFFLGQKNLRSNILKAGLGVSFINVFTVAILLMLKNGQYSGWQIGSEIGFAFLSGFLAAVLTLGLMPFFEAAFRILSTTRLIELSNPNHPLLRKILMETPGTYHHSVIVANLAEGACEAVGANGLLARVGAYYHDIGKTKRPHFFIENQMNMENPHNKIAPQLSKTIIIAHAYDGAEILRKYKLPKEIVDIAEQHHGTTLLKFFYHKANENSEKEIPESEFRYPGPKAQTKEAAIVGIADCMEAAVRSLSKPTPNKIETLVRKIITDRLEDGQFDECDLSLKELDLIARSICETLQGIFHSRIEYPEEIKKKVT